MKGYYLEAKGTNPYENLALEEYLLRLCEKTGDAVLYLWQNADTVVIGRNQNAYTECNMEYIRKHDIHIARRLTGGGAVFHDMGNLNFTIILPKNLYDIGRSNSLVVSALNRIGIETEVNGRNDICIDQKKVSGNAYYSNAKVGMHHGTILYQLDNMRMGKVLSVSPYKLTKHGVSSVKSRVGDILSKYPDISIKDIKESLKQTFCEKYSFDKLHDIEIQENELLNIYAKYASDLWNIEKIQEYEISISESFEWGCVQLSLKLDGNEIVRLEIATDALETDIIEDLKLELNEIIKHTDGKMTQAFFENFAKKHREYEILIMDVKKVLFKLISEIEKENF